MPSENTRRPNRLKELRRQRGLTAYELSQQIGCRENTIYRYEMGYNASLIARHALANALGVNVDDIFPRAKVPA